MKKIYSFIGLLLLSSVTMFGQSGPETETNNNINQANPFNASEATPLLISANITNSSPDDRDFYKITLPSFGAWSFKIFNPSGDGKLNMRVYNLQSTGSQIAQRDFDFSTGLPEPLIINCGQELWVQIDQTLGTDIGAYQLEISSYNSNNSYECNNSFSEAKLIPLNSTFEAKLLGYSCTGANDEDWYKVDVTTGGAFNFDITNVATSQRLHIQVYNASNILVSDEIGNLGSQVSLATLVCSGTYYIRVSDFIGNLLDSPFTVTTSLDTSDASECNNRIEEAYLLNILPENTIFTFNAKILGTNKLVSDGSSLSNSDQDADQDWYKVVAPRGGVLNFNISSVAFNQRLVIEVYNPTNNLVSKIIGDNSTDVSLATLLCSGEYYIRVTDFIDREFDDPYTVAISFDTTDDCECNNRVEEACLIEVLPVNTETTFNAKMLGTNKLVSDGSSISNLDQDPDQDWYKVIAPSGGVLKFDITSVAVNQRLTIQVYNETNNLVSNIIGDNSADVSLSTLLCSGTYFIRVADFLGREFDDPYTVTFKFDTTDSCECNNRIEDACTITISSPPTALDAKILGINKLVSNGSALSGADQDEDQDWYQVEAPSCGILNFNITSVALNQRLKIQMYNASNNEISTIIGSNSQDVSLSTLVSAGTYSIRVTDFIDREFDDPYTVTLTFDVAPIVTLVNTTYSTTQTSGNTYQWSRDGVEILGANSYTYTSGIAGVYTVCISNTSINCSICSTLATTNFENDNQVTIYPNPTNSVLNLKPSKGITIEKVIITDITGKKVLEQNQNTPQINVEQLAKGIYIIEAYAAERKFQSKFIKE